MINISSVGPPPERHADRVIAAMLREAAELHVKLQDEIGRALVAFSAGSPRGQRKIARRLRESGATFYVHLNPGKRGKYKLTFMDITGWNPHGGEHGTGAWIGPDDFIPERPWLAVWTNQIVSRGNYRVDPKCAVLLLVTHHVLSRAAQRLNVRTPQDMLNATFAFVAGILEFIDKQDWQGPMPANGWRIPCTLGTMVVKRDDAKRRFVAVTVFESQEEKSSPQLDG